MKIGQKKCTELYRAIYDEITNARLKMNLSAENDCTLAKMEWAIWAKQKLILGIPSKKQVSMDKIMPPNIPLQIPSGDKCQGCMFLLVICFPSDRAKCNLFKQDLNAKYEYGDMDISTIEKCEECPGQQMYFYLIFETSMYNVYGV